MSGNERDAILAGLEPLFAEAEETGKWFWCNYQDLWFSPAQLRAEHANSKFVWGAPNWKLRYPEERLAEANKRVAYAISEADRIANELARSRPSR